MGNKEILAKELVDIYLVNYEEQKDCGEEEQQNGSVLGRGSISKEVVAHVEDLLKQGISYIEINKQVKYRTKSGKLRHVSIGKISEIKKYLSKKEGAIPD